MRYLVMVALLLGSACKKQSRDTEAQVVAEMSNLADFMCSCNDAACAESVSAAFKRSRVVKTILSDPAKKKRSLALQQRFTECMTNILAAPPAEPRAPIEPRSQIDASGAPKSRYVDEMIREALTWARDEDARARIRSMRFAYVDRTGLLDPTYGELSIEFGRVALEHEKRRVGAPNRSTDRSCSDVYLANGRWRRRQGTCSGEIDYVPHCSVVTIWKRALERHPTIDPDAIAIVTYWAFKKTWIFELNDEPTKLNVREEFPDDCELSVEASGSGQPSSER